VTALMCESCGHHAAAYWLDFTRQGAESFAVCWIYMADARCGPRQPFVTVMEGTA
jgi:hypothetical protein